MNKFSAKAIILLTGAAVLLASVAGAAITYGVKYGPHNLGTTAGSAAVFSSGSTETEICIYCHTPHNAVSGQKWLWNRTGVTTDFRFYTSSPTINYSKGSLSIGETSKMCMTCHDGVTALNAMANPRSGAQSDELGDLWNNESILQNPDNPDDWGKNIGARCTPGHNDCTTGGTIGGAANLTNDHPISFDYVESYNVESAKGTLRSINSVKAAGLSFWGANGQMLECVTCHDPHVNYGCWDWRACDGTPTAPAAHSTGTYDRSLAPFLRRNNNSSGLCFTCHNK